MMNIFSFVGWSGSGKTTLISKLIRELSGRGWTVAAAKKAPGSHQIDPAGKDSSVFLDSGASPVFLTGEDRMMKIMNISGHGELFSIAAEDFRKSDFVLLEGFRGHGMHLFEVFDPAVSSALKSETAELSAVICDGRDFPDVRQFGRDEITRIADHLECLRQSSPEGK